VGVPGTPRQSVDGEVSPPGEEPHPVVIGGSNAAVKGDGRAQIPWTLMLLAHVGHWIWNLLAMAPIIVLAGALIVAQIMHRRHPERVEGEEREAAERAQRELDDILSG
jgi:hypothetical protein